MVSVADVRDELPDWPEPVIQEWLLYFANDGLGWPPPEPNGTSRWAGILGNRPLEWWRDVSWTHERTACGVNELAQKSKQIICEMIAAIDAGTADVETRRRVTNAFHFILDNACFPNAISAMPTGAGLLLLDGHHRFAAFCSLQRMPNEWFERRGNAKAPVEQEVWIGTHSEGELPLG